jgi:hypothetical protein
MAANKGGGPRNKFLIEAWGVPLTLEGLDFDRTGTQEEPGVNMAVLYADGGPLRMSNCRLVTRPGTHFLVWLKAVPDADIRHCLFGGETGAAIVASYCATNDQIVISDCVFAGTRSAFVVDREQVDAASALRVRLSHNTFASVPLRWNYRVLTKRLHVEAEGNLIAGRPVLQIWDTPRETAWQGPLKKLEWVGRRNLYPSGEPLVVLHTTPVTDSASLDAWNRLWDKPEKGSRVGDAKFKGGDASRWSPAAGEADFWHLLPESAGKGAGESGRDLGADADLVGPGPAYERWKRTTEFQERRKQAEKWPGGR